MKYDFSRVCKSCMIICFKNHDDSLPFLPELSCHILTAVKFPKGLDIIRKKSEKVND
jgi:hypothetical protein